ncbi:MAG: hypothetical protein ACRC6B_07110 [Fusobacteriaceae bacterium]
MKKCKHILFAKDEDANVSGGTKFWDAVCILCGEKMYSTGDNMSRNVLEVKKVLKINESDIELVSDGYHTFKELYRHRIILFAWLCNSNKDKAWKSKLHHDGTMYKDYFIVGIDTKFGQTSYHYHIDEWDFFEVKELDNAPVFDGHTSEESLDRLFKEFNS